MQVAPGGAPGGLGPGANPSINVDGLTQVVSVPVRVGGNRNALIVADSGTNPQRAVFVVLSQNGDVAAKIAFPAGYLPLLPPQPQAPPGGGGGRGGPGAINARESAIHDAQANRVIALARSSDGAKHALAIFDIDGGTARAMDLPSGALAANCAPDLRLFDLALGSKVVLPISDRLETAATNPCAATGLLTFDLAGSSLSRLVLPGNGTLDVNSLRMLNDYLYGSNADRVSQQNAISVFVYDPTNDSIRKLDTPRGATAFSGLQPVPATGQLLALATNRAAGDEGLILFDLASGAARLFPVPDGFTRVANPRLLVTNRKLTARGIKADGAQLLVFDSSSGAVTVVPNPDGVQSLGGPSAAGGGGGGQARVVWEPNENSNSILAAAFAGDRPVGVVVIEAI